MKSSKQQGPPKAKGPFARTSRGNTLILLSSALISFGLIFQSGSFALFYVGVGLLAYYFVSSLIVQFKAGILKRVEIRREFDSLTTEDREIRVKIVFINRTITPIMLEVFDQYPPLLRLKQGSNSFIINIPSHGYAEASYVLQPTSVGLHKFGKLKLMLRDFAGLFFYERELDLGSSVEIMPSAKQITKGLTSMVAVSAFGGSITVKRKGEGLEFADIRQYSYGDPYKRIEWHSTARTGKLMVREHFIETQLNVMVILDATETMAYGKAGSTKLDYACRSVASITSYLLGRGDFVGLTVFDGHSSPKVIPLKRGSEQMSRIMRTLASLTPGINNERALADAVRHSIALGGVRGRTLFFVITDLSSRTNLAILKELASMHHEVIVISPLTQLFEVHGMSGLDNVLYSIRTRHMLMQRRELIKDASKIGIQVVDAGPEDMFSKLISKVEELRRMGGS